MQTITLTAEQTRVYDTDIRGWRDDVRPAVYERARALASETGQTVEIHTADGIVIDAIQPE